ncbi:hypothetical protein J3A83DRAFT_4322304 [Scleroderma citrinum]
MLDAFALTDRVALISGENSGLGLAMATALYEAEARDVYCLDLPMEPSEEFRASREYVSKLSDNSRLEYFTTDARDQQSTRKQMKIGYQERGDGYLHCCCCHRQGPNGLFGVSCKAIPRGM